MKKKNKKPGDNSNYYNKKTCLPSVGIWCSLSPSLVSTTTSVPWDCVAPHTQLTTALITNTSQSNAKVCSFPKGKEQWQTTPQLAASVTPVEVHTLYLVPRVLPALKNT